MSVQTFGRLAGLSFFFVFYRCFEAMKGLFPLAGDEVQLAAGFLELFGLQLPALFAAMFRALDQAGTLEDVKVFGDGLACDGGAFGQVGNGERLTAAEAGEDAQARGVAKSRKDRGGGFETAVRQWC